MKKEQKCRFCNNYHPDLRCERGSTVDLEKMYDYIEQLENALARARVPVSMLMEDDGADDEQRTCAVVLWCEISRLLGDV